MPPGRWRRRDRPKQGRRPPGCLEWLLRGLAPSGVWWAMCPGDFSRSSPESSPQQTAWYKRPRTRSRGGAPFSLFPLFPRDPPRPAPLSHPVTSWTPVHFSRFDVGGGHRVPGDWARRRRPSAAAPPASRRSRWPDVTVKRVSSGVAKARVSLRGANTSPVRVPALTRHDGLFPATPDGSQGWVRVIAAEFALGTAGLSCPSCATTTRARPDRGRPSWTCLGRTAGGPHAVHGGTSAHGGSTAHPHDRASRTPSMRSALGDPFATRHSGVTLVGFTGQREPMGCITLAD